MTSTSTTASSPRRRLAAAAVSLTMITGFAVGVASSAGAATLKAKPKARPALLRKATVVTPSVRVAIPSAAITPAPAWQTSG